MGGLGALVLIPDCRNPDEVTVDDVGDESDGTSANTPAADAGDEFFSSWDKPTIKRPSNPPSRTGTPGINRTASPFLNANQNGAASRPKSPLIGSETAESTTTAAPRAISATAMKKTAISNKPKANILGAKKTKLGAKKVDAAVLDFDEAEKKAREEAERKEKLGYDPDEVTPSESQFTAAQPETGITTLHQPTPVNPGRAGGFGATAQSRQRDDSEVERLGMGVRKLGFGQVGASAAKAAAPQRMGFGATSKAPVQGTTLRTIIHHIISQLTSPSRRLRTLRARQIRPAKRHLVRRVLRARQLQPQCTSGSAHAPARLRGRHVHLVQRLLRPAGGRGGEPRGLRRFGERGAGLCAQVWHYRGGRY